MKKISYIEASTIAEAKSLLGPDTWVLAGGTDLLGLLKDYYSPVLPDVVVNIKTISGMDTISESGGQLKIGALATLSSIASSSIVQNNYAALAEACRRTASPELRNMGTIGGNICQKVRCWYYRHPNNFFDCIRKGGSLCNATLGDNRFNSIFGLDPSGCAAVNPSDTAPALIALGATVVTTDDEYAAEDFFTSDGEKTTVLAEDEIVREIVIPTPAAGTKSTFVKFAMRKAFDFPIVNCAIARNGESGRLCLNAVWNKPRWAEGDDAALTSASSAAEAAVAGNVPLPHNKYMVQIIKTLVKRAFEATA